MDLRKKAIMTLVSLFMVNTLSGCGGGLDEKNIKSNIDNNGNHNIENEMSANLEIKVFDEGEHLLEYVAEYDADYNYYLGYVPSIQIPEGYSIVDIEMSTRQNGYGSKTDKVLYFFVNDEKVEAQGVIDEKTGEVVYPNPGTPVSKNLTLEK